MTKQLNAKDNHDLDEVSEAKEGVIWLLNAELVAGGSVANDDNEEEVAEDVPIEVVEICWIG